MNEVELHERISPELYDEIFKNPDATVFHTPAWHSVLKRTFGWPVQLATARSESGDLMIALPFVRRRRMLVKHIRVCLPMTDVAGPLIRAGTPDELYCQLGRLLAPVEVRAAIDSSCFQKDALYTRSVLDLANFDDTDALLRSFHKTSVQQRIRRASREGITVVLSHSRNDYDQFGRLIAQTRRKHGAPSFPRSFFAEIHGAMQPHGMSRLYLAYMDDQCIAGQLFFCHGSVGTSSYSASVPDRHVQRSGANQAVKWAAIRDAFTDGLRTIDFGIANTQQPNLRIYKEQWGAVSRPLSYSYSPPGQPSSRIGQESAAGKFAKRIFSALPMPIYTRLTPLIHRLAA